MSNDTDTYDGVDGITDGIDEHGNFVRVFWDWDLEVPDLVIGRARIAGEQFEEPFSLDHHREDCLSGIVRFGPHYVTIPTNYLQVNIACIDSVLYGYPLP